MPYIFAVLLFLLVIFIHELGHFIAAKLLGVKVNEFSIGFGPTFLKKKIGETLYAVRPFPLGGYCAMEGEDEGSDDKRAFCNRPAYRRLIIVVAGAFMNILLGFILVLCTMLPASRLITTEIGGFHTENSLTEQSGINIGDKIVKVNNRSVVSYYDLSYAFSNVSGDTLNVTVLRDGKEKVIPLRFETEQDSGINFVKIDFYLNSEKKTFGSLIRQSFCRTVSYEKVVWYSLLDLLTGKYGISAVSGPVGVAAAIGTAAKSGLSDLLPMLALITINLGIFNLLPVPALDGGRAFFLLVEMIIRKPIPKRFEATVHAAGLVLLLMFSAFITVKDIVGLF